jgi:aryl-alcohol dehydrogenase-like predicted oxidoreductase
LSKVAHLEENVGAADLMLTPDDLAEIDAVTADFAVQGERLPNSELKMARL